MLPGIFLTEDKMKRILTVQDISCVGKCSLTVALPIISAMGVETAVMPTAVLSTHTAFPEFTFRDLTEDIPKIAKVWENQRIGFDAIYTGYLGSRRQMSLVSDLIDTVRGENGFVLVDPAMADNGKLYAGFTKEFASDMAELCTKADVIVPNLTEAAFLLDIPCPSADCSKETMKELLKRLAARGTRRVVITGYSSGDETLGAISYDAQENEFFVYERKRYPQMFHGTGDVFASVLTGALTRGRSFEEAVCLSVDFVAECIRRTLADENYNWYGVNFEQALPWLISQMN